MTQYVINIGTIPNDGTGDPLRTAFNETNLNFDQVFAAGPVLSNIQIANNKILTLNTNGNLILAPNGTGIVQANVSIVPNTANLRDLGSATNRWRTVYTQYLNITIGSLTVPAIVTSSISSDDSTFVTIADGLNVDGDIETHGNVTADYFIGDGSQLTGLGATYSNANVVTLLAGFGSNTVSTTGNISGGFILGNGSQLTGITAASSYGNANVANLLAAFGSNAISTSGNISGGFILGNGSQLTGLPATYGNANVATFLAAFGSNTISTTGNITTTANVSGGFILGNVAFANGISTYGNANVVANLAALGSNPVSTTGNVTGAYILGNGSQLTGLAATYGNANVVANLAALGSNPVSTTGNVTGAFILGNGSQLTSLPAPAVTQDITSNGAMSIMTYDGTIKYVNYATVEPSSGNIAGGNITTTGLVSATGNITAGNVNSPTLNNSGNIRVVASGNTWTFGTDGNLTVPGNILGSGNILIAPDSASASSYLDIYLTGGPDIHIASNDNSIVIGRDTGANVFVGNDGEVSIRTDNGTTAQVWLFDDAGNLTVPGGGAVFTIGTGTIGVTANATSGNAYLGLDDTGSAATLYGNAGVQIGTNGNVGWNFDAAGDLGAPGNISAVGNITGAYILGNGSQLTGLPATYGNSNVATFLAAFGSNTVSTTGNVTAGYLLGNGSQLTGLPATYGNSNVATFLAAFGSNSISTTGNITTGNLVTGGASGNIFGANNISANTFSASGNVTSGGLTVNGSAIITGNANVQGTLTYNNLTNITTANLVFGLGNTQTGINVTGGGFVVGNTAEASFLYNYTTQAWNSNIGISAVGNVAGGNLRTAGLISATGNLTAGNVSATNITGTLATAAQTNITSVGTLGALTVTANVTGGNILTGGLVSATGNVTGAYIIGNGSQLTGLPASYTNANVSAFLAAFGANTISTTGSITSGNVTGGNVLTGGVVSATGNITGGNVSATNIVGTLTTAAQTNITSVGTLGALTVTANVTGGNIRTAGVISSTGNITGGNVGATLLSGTTVSATANVVGGNITTAGVITATGNITGGNISATNHTGTTVSVTGNVTGGNITTAGQISATGNITTANSFVGNLVGTTVSITGNVSAGNVIVNGQSTTYGVVTPAYMVVGLVNTVTGFGVGSTVIFDTVVGNANSQTSYNASTGVFTLTAGVTYDMSFTPSFIAFSNTTSGFVCYDWVDATTNTPLDSTGTGTGTGVPNTETSSQQDNLTARVIYTPNTNQTVKLRVNSGNGTVNLRGGLGTQAVIKPLNPTIAVQATATGTINNQYISVTNISNQTGSYGVKDIALDTVLGSSGIAYNTSTGVYTLTAGVAYRITSQVGFYNATPGYLLMAWVDATSNTPINSVTQTIANNNWPTGQIDPLTMDFVYTPVTNQTIKLRATATSNNTFSLIGSGDSKVVIQQINQAFALNALATMSVTGNITTTGNVSATGNVYGTNLTDKTSSSWTVTTGTNTYSITVPINGNYQIWVRCNIPNGIFAYQATVSVTNTNVPVLGTQRAYNYTGGGSPILLTTMPTQIVGVEGTISTAVVATTTANRFDFVINNTSGSSQTVYWGYVTL